MIVNKNDLKDLQAATQAPAVSILIPTHRISSEQHQDYIRLKNAINEAQKQLTLYYDKKASQPLIERLWQLLEGMDYSALLEGLAIFISPSTEKVIDLPFPVEERIIVDESFEVRDILLALNKSVDYYLLLLHGDRSNLCIGKGPNLKPVNDENFPLTFDATANQTEKTQFTNTGAGSLHGATEKTQIEQKKITHFLSQVDQSLTPYLNNNAQPVFLAGSKTTIDEFKNLTRHVNHIQGSVTGNLKHETVHELADQVQQAVNQYLANIRQSALEHLEQVDRSLVTAGLPQVYQEAAAGRGATLLVEKGYTEPGYLDQERQLLYLNPEQKADLKPLQDAVDDTIELVTSKGGEVRFVANEKLKPYDRIALIMRY